MRVSESTTRNPKPKPKRPHSGRWVYLCRCWFALASGYDWRSLGGKWKITWMVIANKSGVEKKTKEILYRAVIFLGEFSHCGYKFFLKKLRKFVLIVWVREKNAQKMEKMDNVYKLQNWEKKKKKKKTLVQRYIYVCTLNKWSKNMLWN